MEVSYIYVKFSENRTSTFYFYQVYEILHIKFSFFYPTRLVNLRDFIFKLNKVINIQFEKYKYL